jgi:integrase
VLKRLTEAAGIDVDEGYLQPHGARRGMIGEVYKRDRGEAQDLGRHKSMETTREAYSHLDAEEQRERLNDPVKEFQLPYRLLGCVPIDHKVSLVSIANELGLHNIR